MSKIEKETKRALNIHWHTPPDFWESATTVIVRDETKTETKGELFRTTIITLQEETEHVEQEEDAHAVQVGEESLVVHDGQSMGAHIADNVRDADNNEQHRVHQAGDDEQRSPVRWSDHQDVVDVR